MINTGILEALIPLCGGIYGTLLGFKRIAPVQPSPRATVLLAQLKWLGPLVIVFGLWLLWQAFVDKEPNVEEIVRGMRERVTLPVNIDEATRLDAFDYEKQHIIYRMTITRPPPTESERISLISALHQRFVIQECKSENYQRLLAQGISLRFVYTIDSTQYPGIVVNQKNCGHG